jgi:hypothetical protein
MGELENNINNQIIDLWEKNHGDLQLDYRKDGKDMTAELFWPNLHLPAPKNIDLLVIGLNPSHKFPKHKSKVINFEPESSENKIFKEIKASSYTDGEIVDSLKYSNTGYSVKEILEFERFGQKHHNYFQKFWQLGSEIFGKSGIIHHFDLYQFRESSSELMKKSFIPKNPCFFEQQAKLTFEYIAELNPKLIFVANKYASDEFNKQYNPEWVQQWGCHKIIIDNKETPLLLSGMITQSRAIDNFSFDRLVWHMKYINTALNSVQAP